MISSEIFKITRHRTPWAIAGMHLALTLIAPIYYVFKRPADEGDYLSTSIAVFGVSGLLFAAVLGAWFVGNEYRHGTLRRVLAVDARRGRLLATKAGLGLATWAASYVLVGLLGAGAAWLAATVNGDGVVTTMVLREAAGPALGALVTGAMAFALSTILRSDTYAMLGAVTVMIVLGPLAAGIPTVGDYTLYAVTLQLGDWMLDSSIQTPISVGAAAGTLMATLAVLGAGSARLFINRDV